LEGLTEFRRKEGGGKRKREKEREREMERKKEGRKEGSVQQTNGFRFG
jgi:hypothetical protein